MLDNWLASLSKNVLATFGILGGIALVVLLNPPHSRCDTQEEQFRENMSKFFFIDRKKKEVIKKNRFTLALDNCRNDPNSGSCYDFFDVLRHLNRELDAVSDMCIERVANIKEIKLAMWDGIELMVRLAWGEKGPTTYAERRGWFNEADIALFCNTKMRVQKAFGEERWKKFREGQFKKLPGTEDLSRDEIWSRILFSVSCRYL